MVALTGSSLLAPVSAIALVQAVCVAAGIWVAWRALRRVSVSPLSFALATLLVIANPVVFKMLFSGMEGALGFVVLCAYLGVVVDAQTAEKVDTRRLAAYAGVSALLVLARLDYAILLLAVAIVLVRRRRRDGLMPTLVVGGAVAAVLAAYLAWNYAHFGIPLPVSGLAKSWYVSGASAGERIFGGLAEMAGMPVLVARRVFEFLSARPAAFAVMGLSLAACAVIAARMATFGRGTLGGLRLLVPYGVALTVHLVYLFVYLGRFAITFWYYVPEVVGALFALAVVIGALRVRAGARAGAARLAAAAVVAVIAVGYVAMYATYTLDPARKTRYIAAYHTGVWMAENLAPQTRVGSWNAGALGYFSRRTVINLDGLVNGARFVQEYLSTGRTAEYIAEEDITHLADYATSSEWFNRYGEFTVLYERRHGLDTFSFFEDKPSQDEERFFVIELVR